MRSTEEKELALDLSRRGLSASAVARATGVPRTTVRDWRNARARPRNREPVAVESLPPETYAYLLGVYLGDGHIAAWRRGLFQLRVSCDDAYPAIIDEVRAAMATVKGRGRPLLCSRKDSRCTVVQSAWRDWPVVFPQHGPGPKHRRPIVLDAWQRTITAAHPHLLVRGLVHSDGSRYVARQRCATKTYAYVRYAFKNRSPDIIDILCEHLGMLDVGWARAGADQVCVNRRSDVARLDTFVGPKR